MQSHQVPILRTGIIAEPGAAHLDHYLEAIGACLGVEPVGFADGSSATFAQARLFLPKAVLYESPERMLTGFKPHFVMVLLEAAHGPEWVLRALAAGCHVLSEKHPAADPRDLRPIFEEAHRRNGQLQLAFTNRCHPVVEKARDALRDGRMGRLFGAHLLIAADQARLSDRQFAQSWRAVRAKSGGGVLMALGIHHIDLLPHLASENVRRVTAQCANAGGAEVDIEDSCAVALELSGGAVATLLAGFYLDRGYQSVVELWMSGGWLRLQLGPVAQLEWHHNDEATATWAPVSAGNPTR